MKPEAQKQLIKKLSDMFQFDQASLDFGIYRIMSQKRDVIQQFLEKELPDEILCMIFVRAIEKENFIINAFLKPIIEERGIVIPK